VPVTLHIRNNLICLYRISKAPVSASHSRTVCGKCFTQACVWTWEMEGLESETKREGGRLCRKLQT